MKKKLLKTKIGEQMEIKYPSKEQINKFVLDDKNFKTLSERSNAVHGITWAINEIKKLNQVVSSLCACEDEHWYGIQNGKKICSECRKEIK